MIIRKAFDVDIIEVICDLSEITQQELAAFGKTLEDAAEYALRKLADHGASAGIVDGKVVVVFGLDYSVDDAVYTWILATDGYFKQGTSGYKKYRKFMKEVVSAHEKPVMSISGSKHPDIERWFALSGAKPVLKTDNATVFLYS